MNDQLDSTWFYQAQNALYLLARPEGMVGLLFYLLLFVLCLSSRTVRMTMLAFMMWVCTLGFFKFGTHLVTPIDQIRLYGRGITTAALIALVLPSLTAMRGWRRHALAGSSVGFYVFQMFFSFREVTSGAGGSFGRFTLAAILFTLMMIVLGYGLPRWIQSMPDFNRVVHYVGVAAAIFCGGVFAQVLVNRSVAEDGGGRLAGTTGNPQHCAVMLALCLPPLCYLVVRRGQRFFWRVAFGAIASLAGIFLLWTGSRTGALMSLVGLVAMFRYRMGRLVLLASFAAIFVMFFLSMFSGDQIFSEHLLSTQDSRTFVWWGQFSQFMHHPVLGSNAQSYGVSENSYLATAARYGLLGLTPMFIWLAAVVRGMYHLHRVRKYLGKEVLAADMVTAGLIALFVGAWFEAYLLGTLTFMVFYAYVLFAMLNAIIELATADQQRGFEVVIPEESNLEFAAAI